MKTKKIGNIGMSAEAYDKFVSLPYKEQEQRVYDSLNPKDYLQAAKALKGIPNGDIGSRNDEASTESNTTGVAEGSAPNRSKKS